ncbi:MAG: DUF3459 domain-containing protein [Armatimonadetes bacterium]|nr:DUF3459 domain-containing protein [Armatimonadota bacterium]
MLAAGPRIVDSGRRHAVILGLVLQNHWPTVFEFRSEKKVKSVHVAGTFNNWDKGALAMRELAANTWTASLDLRPGKYQYKFVIDGDTWVTDPSAKTIDDGNGNTNSVLVVFPEGYEVPARKGDGTITTSMVRHLQEIPALNYDRGKLTLTVQARVDDVQTVSALVQIGNNKPKAYGATASGGDDFVTNYVATVPWDGKSVVKYSFSLNDGGRGPLTVDKSGAWYAKDGGDARFVLDPKTFHPFVPPGWVEKSIVYQIFPDRFANGDKSNDPKDVQPWNGTPTYANWFGGDIAGVRQHLGHLKEMGVGCIYFNPIFEGPSNHRYETTDYLKVDHRFGTNKEFAALTSDLHKQGVRTILDGVFNHTSVDFFAFADLLKNQDRSKYRDWYTVKSFPVKVGDNPAYEAWFGFPSMPKLHNADKSVRDYLLSVPDFWDKEAKIDGWRLDVANEVPSDYWRLFRDRVKRHGQDKWIVGEIWGDGSPWLKGDQFDSVMNYQFREAVLGFVARGATTPTQFWNRLMAVYDSYGPQVSRNMMNLLSSHDTPRILTECGGDAQLARLAAMIQFTWVGAPCVYYGDELGMAGGRDPENRRGMEWNRAVEGNPYLQAYKALSSLRKDCPALQSGDPSLVSVDDAKGLVVFSRNLDGQRVLVAVNRSKDAQTVKVPVVSEGMQRTSFVNGEDRFATETDFVAARQGGAWLAVHPYSVSILRTVPSAHSSTRNHSTESHSQSAIRNSR